MVDDLFIQPAVTDYGTAIGAAIASERRAGRWTGQPRMPSVYWVRLQRRGDRARPEMRGFRIRSCRRSGVRSCGSWRTGFVVGWFQGRMEFGPRALGNRSIIADPRHAANCDRVNASVKFREEWRPFAPALP